MSRVVQSLVLIATSCVAGCGTRPTPPKKRTGPTFFSIHRVVDRGAASNKQVPTFSTGEPMWVSMPPDITNHDITHAEAGPHDLGFCVSVTVASDVQERLQHKLDVGMAADPGYPRLAMVLDGKVIAIPAVHDRVPKVLTVLRMGKNTGFTEEDAEELAARLNEQAGK